MTRRRRLCRSGPGPVPQERPALWRACIAGYGVRLPRGHPDAIPRRLPAQCTRRRLPPWGCSPLGWTSTCRWSRPGVAGHSKMTASCAPGPVAAGSQGAPSGGQAARPTSALARRPGGGGPAREVTGWPLIEPGGGSVGVGDRGSGGRLSLLGSAARDGPAAAGSAGDLDPAGLGLG
jgi:hypothetical protein